VKWKLLVRRQVRREVEDAAEWYRNESPELKSQFLDAIDRALESLAENPRLASLRLEATDVRWVHPQRFPYRIIYRLDPDREEVVALMLLHNARDDWRWIKRVQEP
jgi:plasmid stabilization system protein ParE